MIWLIYFFLFVNVVLSKIEYKKLVQYEINSKILYNHEIKSFKDGYKAIIINNSFLIILSIMYKYVLIYLSWCCGELHIGVTICTNIYLLAVFLVLCYGLSFSMYIFTEIKHNSKHDNIGENIHKSDNHIIKKSKKYYASLSLMGLINIIYINILVYSKFKMLLFPLIVIGLFIFLLGMGDVLQHKKYNNDDYKERCKGMSFTERYYIVNIIRLITNNKYRSEVNKTIKYNTKNIIYGIHNTFHS